MSRRSQRSASRPASVAPSPAVDEKAAGAPAPSGELTGGVVLDLPIWYQFVRYGGQISPTQITTAIQLADSGNIQHFVDLVHEFRQKDLHFHACATTFEADISGLNWHAVPAGGSKNPKKSEAKLARILDAVVDECIGFTDMLAHEAGEGELFGHATSEALWGWYESTNPVLKNWFLPKQFKTISCRRFGFRQSDGRLLFDPGVTGNVDMGAIDLLAKYPAGKFIQHRPRVNGDAPIREGIGRGIVWPCCFRNWDIRDWLLLAEQGWKPLRVLTVKKTGGSVDKSEAELAQLIAQRLVSTGCVVKPDTIDLMVEWAKNTAGAGQGQHRELAEWLGQEISKGLLGHTQIVEVGAKGARSASEVGYSVSKDRRRPRALALAATIHQQFTIPLFRYNAPGKRPPYLLPDLDDPINAKEFSEFLRNLTAPTTGAGLAVPARWARERVGMPMPEAGEEMVGGTVWVDPDEAAAAAQAQQDPNQPDPNQNGDQSGDNGAAGDGKPKPTE